MANKDDLAQLAIRLIKWMVAQGLVTIGLNVAALKLLGQRPAIGAVSIWP